MTDDFEKMVERLADRFVSWSLPQSVCADLCATDSSYKFPRSGTNLLSVDEAREMVRYLLAAEAVAWRPIAEAPRDGAWILGWAQSDSSPYRVSYGRNHNGDLAWCTSFASFVGGYITHWMPLPSPPQGEFHA